jgi:hypothetical protein
LTNPIRIAAQGKGFLPMLTRGRVIAGRYGFTPRKMDNALEIFWGILKQSACSATFPVTASALNLNPALGMKYHGLGLELAVHGLHHIDYSLLNAETQVIHLGQARDIFRKLGIPVTGFRCPYLRWNYETLAALRATGFLYDSSQALTLGSLGSLNTDTYRRVLDFYRAETAQERLALPVWTDGLIRIPYCLPDDEALVDRLHVTDPGEMAQIWLGMLDATYQSGELFTLGLHPERIHLCQEALQAVLKKARSLSPSVWIARLDEIVHWFQLLGQATFEYERSDGDLIHLKLSAPVGATFLVRDLNIQTTTLPWAQGYRAIAENEFTVQSNKLPWIGLAPKTPIALQKFLQHQGFLIEISTDALAYTCYLDRSTFTQRDERPLFVALEQENFPLVRISRWPDGARSGLAVTGDVDAFTIWDYGRRIFVH